MATYRKQPLEIEAFKWTVDQVPDWWREASKDFLIDIPTTSVFIPTIEGTMEAKKGDYIIKGIKGEIYPCKPEIFEQSYELVE